MSENWMDDDIDKYIYDDIIECSDDDNYGFVQNKKNECHPEPFEICDMYRALNSGLLLNLEWTCPGRRALTPDNNNISPDNSHELSDVTESSVKTEVKLDFDFEEDTSPLNLDRRRGTKQLIGSARKKTTNLDAVLSKMAKHQKLDNMPDEKRD